MKYDYFVSYRYYDEGGNGWGFWHVVMDEEVTTFEHVARMASIISKENPGKIFVGKTTVIPIEYKLLQKIPSKGVDTLHDSGV